MSSLSGLSEFVEENKVRVYCLKYCMKLVYSLIIVQYLYAAYYICRACIQYIVQYLYAAYYIIIINTYYICRACMELLHDILRSTSIHTAYVRVYM